MATIRNATTADLAEINEIYNDAVINTVATFDTEPKNPKEQKAWFEKHDSRHPILVAEENGQVVGWVSLSVWSDKGAYSDTAEISLYVRKECQGKGIGKRLLEAILKEGKKIGLHTVIARIAEGNEASIGLSKSFGFKEIGVMREVGWKFGRRLDIHMMQLIFENKSLSF